MPSDQHPSVPARPELNWDEIDRSLGMRGREGAREKAARFSLGVLRAVLGEDWLPRATAAGDGEVPLNLHLLGAHTLVLAETLEWALRLKMCEEWEGGADFLRDLVRDPRPGRIEHSRSQLLLAGLARRLDWPVRLEPQIDGGPPADIALTGPSGSFSAELRALTESADSRGQLAAVGADTDWLFQLGLTHGVWIGGQLSRAPSERERLEFERFLDMEAPDARDGACPTFERDGISLRLTGRGSGAPGLRSPAVREELFGRMVRVIAEKASRMEDSGAEWLHVTVLTGLWGFTTWGRSPLAERLTTMAGALRGALGTGRLSGIVLTSAAGSAYGGVRAEGTCGEACVGLVCPVRPLRARQTLAIDMSQGGTANLRDWPSLMSAERGWLDWALHEHQLPTLEEIFGSSAL